MITNQEGRIRSIKEHYVIIDALTHNGYYIRMFDLEGIPAGTFNERMLGWLKSKFDPADYPFENINNLLQKYAEYLGFYNWNSVNDLFPLTSKEYFFQDGTDFDFQNLDEFDFN